MTDETKPWGRVSTLLLGIAAMLAGQIVALVALTWWYGRGLSQLPDFSGDGVAVSLIILVSTPFQIALLALFALRRSPSAAGYLGLVMPRRSDVVFGVLAVIALIVAANTVSWLLGRPIVTSFQNDIYRTADTAGAMALLWFAVVVGAPAGEEVLFRGFLFRGWLRAPRDTWPVIFITALLFALLHVQYDTFVMAQIFLFGLLLGFMRWASGSTLLTILLHALINLEGMIETWIGFNAGT
jgi:membrane protease YdiL (CAAX protease family)